MHAPILRFLCWSWILYFPSVHVLEITLPVLYWHRLIRKKHNISGYKKSFPACSTGQNKHQPFLKPICILCSTASAILNQKIAIMRRPTFLHEANETLIKEVNVGEHAAARTVWFINLKQMTSWTCHWKDVFMWTLRFAWTYFPCGID